MQTAKGTLDAVRDLVADILDVAPELLDLDAHLILELGMDSLTMADVVVTLDERLGVRVPDLMVREEFVSVRAIARVIDARRALDA